MFYLSLDKNGYLKGYFQVDNPPEIIEEESPLFGIPSLNSLDCINIDDVQLSAYYWDGEGLVLDDKKLAEIKELEKESKPSEHEQLRADVDFLLVMGGYIK